MSLKLCKKFFAAYEMNWKWSVTTICVTGFYAQNAPPFEYTPQNVLCGLNTVGYSVKPKAASTDALVAISINKKPEEIRWSCKSVQRTGHWRLLVM